MKRILLIILPVIFFIGCTIAPKKGKDPIAVKELTTVSETVKAGTLLLYAEDYKNRTNADFSKAGLRVVLLTLQNTSTDDVYQLNPHDIHGMDSLNSVQKYNYSEAMYLMNSSAGFIKTTKADKVVQTMKKTAAGAPVGGGIGGFYFGYDYYSFVIATAAGAGIGAIWGLIDGIKGEESYYEEEVRDAIAEWISFGKLPDIVTIHPGSKINGILFFPQGVDALTADINGVTHRIDIH